MQKKISYKKRFYTSLILLVMGAFISYFFAIRNTIGIVKKCNYYKTKARSYELLQSQENTLKTTLNEINQIIVNDTTTIDEFSKQIFDFVSQIAEQHAVQMINFNQPIIADDAGFKVETYSLVLKGGYINLLKACNQIENKIEIGKMVALAFYTEKTTQNKSEILCLNIYIQCVKKIS
jgi:hypothetical protein